MGMSKIQQRMANELSNNKLLLNSEIQPDVMFKEKSQVGEKDRDGSQITRPEMQPVELVCLSDNKESAVEELVIETDTSDCEGISNCVVAWDSLNNKMREVLPCISTSGGSTYTYFVEKYEDLILEEFSDAAEECFNAEFKINLHSEEEGNNWITDFSVSSQCTYRKTCTYKPTLERVLFKLDMHCHRYRKHLTAKQLNAKSKKVKNKKPLSLVYKTRKQIVLQEFLLHCL